MKSVTSVVALSKHPWIVVDAVITVEARDIQPVLDHDFWESLHVIRSCAASQSNLLSRKSHMGEGLGGVEGLTVPARWEPDGSRQASGARCELWEADGCVWSPVAQPIEFVAASIGGAVVRTQHCIASHHSEILWKFASFRVEDITRASVLVIDLMFRCFGNSNEAAVVGRFVIQSGHPVIALVGFYRECAAVGSLGQSKVHGRSKGISANDRVYVVRGFSGAQEGVNSLNNNRHTRSSDEERAFGYHVASESG